MAVTSQAEAVGALWPSQATIESGRVVLERSRLEDIGCTNAAERKKSRGITKQPPRNIGLSLPLDLDNCDIEAEERQIGGRSSEGGTYANALTEHHDASSGSWRDSNERLLRGELESSP